MTETTSMDLFAEKLCKTVIIGLPGIGKTTMTDYLAGQYTEMSGKTLETVSTDKEMRAYIADRNNPLTDKFLTDRRPQHSDTGRAPLVGNTGGFYGKIHGKDFPRF